MTRLLLFKDVLATALDVAQQGVVLLGEPQFVRSSGCVPVSSCHAIDRDLFSAVAGIEDPRIEQRVRQATRRFERLVA